MMFRITDDSDAAATFPHDFGLGHSVSAVIGAFGVNVGPEFADQGAHIQLRKNYDGIHVGESGQDLCPLVIGRQGPTIALQSTDRGIGIDRNDKSAAQLLGGMQVANVTDVQEIESAVGQDDAVALSAPFRHLASQCFAVE